jgi:Undecaprenyl-phosphate glucose phosphotransferase
VAKRSEATEQGERVQDGSALPSVEPRPTNGAPKGHGRNGRRTAHAPKGNGANTSQALARTLTPTLTPGEAVTPQVPEFAPAPHHPTRLGPVALVLAEMALDIAAITVAFVLAYWLRFNSDIYPRFSEPDTATYATMLGVTVATMVMTFYFSRLYTIKRGASRVDEFYKIAAAISMGTVLSLALNSFILGDAFVYSRLVPPIGWLLAIIFVTLGRLIYSVIIGELRKQGIGRAHVLVIGTGPTAYTVASRLEWQRTLGYKVAGMVESTEQEVQPGRNVGKIPVLGSLPNLVEIIRREHVDEVIVALQGASDTDLRSILSRIKDETVSVKIYPDALQLMTQYDVSVGELSGLPLLNVRDVALRGWNRRIKRAFDIIFSGAVLVLTSPVLLLIALIVKLSSPGPVFFIQERVGLDNKPFRLVKFRSMRTDADPSGWTTANDPRRTSVGSIIRRFSLDELPQFFNVLIGEMSVVGPRPEQPEYVKEFAEKIPDYLRRHREKAGITGWAQVNGFRGDSSIEVRTALDLYYVENWSVLFDLKIIVRTLVAMFRGKNAY